MSKPTLLLTGATGYLGSSLLKSLVSSYTVVAVKRSFSNTVRLEGFLDQVYFYDLDQEGWPFLFEKHSIDLIIHCATNYGRKGESELDILEANLLFPLRLLALAKKHGVKRFINTDTVLDRNLNAYSLAKKQFLEWFSFSQANQVCINVEMEHFYGPGEDRSKFVSWLIDSFLNQKDHLDLTLGEQERDFIFIADVIEGYKKLIQFSLEAADGFYPFKIGSNDKIQVRHLVELIKNLTGNTTTQLNFGALPYRKNEIMKVTVDTSEIAKLGWQPSTPLRVGLQKTIEIEKNVRGKK